MAGCCCPLVSTGVDEELTENAPAETSAGNCTVRHTIDKGRELWGLVWWIYAYEYCHFDCGDDDDVDQFESALSHVHGVVIITRDTLRDNESKRNHIT